MTIEEKENRVRETNAKHSEELLEMIATGEMTVERALAIKDNQIQFWHKCYADILNDLPHILWARDRGERFVPKRRDL
jgi:hypothetical protein